MASLSWKKNEGTRRYVLKVSDSLSEPVEIEVVSNVVLVDLNEELVSFEIAEPLNPAGARLAVVFFIQIL
jgi:hypothetical protein